MVGLGSEGWPGKRKRQGQGRVAGWLRRAPGNHWPRRGRMNLSDGAGEAVAGAMSAGGLLCGHRGA